jgi:hypothetical protein
MVPRTSRRVPKETVYIMKNVELLKLKCFQNIKIKTNFVSFIAAYFFKLGAGKG